MKVAMIDRAHLARLVLTVEASYGATGPVREDEEAVNAAKESIASTFAYERGWSRDANHKWVKKAIPAGRWLVDPPPGSYDNALDIPGIAAAVEELC
jgi:hypothetical protein